MSRPTHCEGCQFLGTDAIAETRVAIAEKWYTCDHPRMRFGSRVLTELHVRFGPPPGRCPIKRGADAQTQT